MEVSKNEGTLFRLTQILVAHCCRTQHLTLSSKSGMLQFCGKYLKTDGKPDRQLEHIGRFIDLSSGEFQLKNSLV